MGERSPEPRTAEAAGNIIGIKPKRKGYEDPEEKKPTNFQVHGKKRRVLGGNQSWYCMGKS